MSTNDHLIFLPKPIFLQSFLIQFIQLDVQARNLGVMLDALFPYSYSRISKACFYLQNIPQSDPLLCTSPTQAQALPSLDG